VNAEDTVRAEKPGRNPSLHDRTAAAILEAASHVLAEREGATMTEIAEGSGVGRTTLYRYFATRDALLASLATAALAEAAGAVAAAGLERAPVPEALARVVRALLAVGDRYVVLVREQVLLDEETLERELAAPVRAVIERGRRDGELRADVPAEWLLELFVGLLTAGVRLVGDRRAGLEEVAALVTDTFLDGARKT
jgi:TetR/AcrR family transcriptional regulator, mexCD-oprJ operon repressor